MIGLMLVAGPDSISTSRKGYLYFAMGFSVLVGLLNIRMRGKAGRPIELHRGRTRSASGLGFRGWSD